jgi:hypothetical protein
MKTKELSRRDLLLIRQCKSRKPCIKKLSKIFTSEMDLPRSSSAKIGVSFALQEIADEHGLIRDINNFILGFTEIQMQSETFDDKTLSHVELYVKALINVIRWADVNIFSNYVPQAQVRKTIYKQ